MYPEINSEWILETRGAKNKVAADLPYAHLLEWERSSWGEVSTTATIFLTNRECPFRCLMCDLWKNTTDQTVSSSNLLRQIDFALADLNDAPLPKVDGVTKNAAEMHVSQWKLYNSGNFFDKKAIPAETLPGIIERANRQSTLGLRNIIIECHPKLVGQDCMDFANRLVPSLEVAMGLETIHPGVLPKLNKQMSLDQFQSATELLKKNGITVRAFILLRPPFLNEEEGIEWAVRSAEWAFDIGVDCCAVIPTRSGNGAIDRLAELGRFHEPKLKSLEVVQETLLHRITNQQRLFVDVWDANRFSTCNHCVDQRIERLNRVNLEQQVEGRIDCEKCET